MSLALVSLSSSLGDRKVMLHDMLTAISKNGRVTKLSDIYETTPKDDTSVGPFLNCCAEIETSLTSLEFVELIKLQQQKLTESESRKKKFVQQDVAIDLIAFDNEVVRTPKLTLPHPSAHRRAFVMIPLATIAPDWVHPVLGKTASVIARETYWTGWGNFFATAKSLLDF